MTLDSCISNFRADDEIDSGIDIWDSMWDMEYRPESLRRYIADCMKRNGVEPDCVVRSLVSIKNGRVFYKEYVRNKQGQILTHPDSGGMPLTREASHPITIPYGK